MEAFLSTEFAEKLKSEAVSRPEDSHKGSFGRILAICGSYGMAGAAYLSALAAYRTGAGLVEIFTPVENRSALQALIPEAIIKTYDSECFDPYLLTDSIDKCDALLIGPGLGMSRMSFEILRTALRHSRVPTVIDADALNLLAEHNGLACESSNNLIATLQEKIFILDSIVIDLVEQAHKNILQLHIGASHTGHTHTANLESAVSIQLITSEETVTRTYTYNTLAIERKPEGIGISKRLVSCTI